MRKLINWGPWSEPSMTMPALTDTALSDELAVDIDQMLVDAFAAKPTPIETEVVDITAKRKRYQDRIDDLHTARAFHACEIEKIDDEEEQIVRILAGLKAHEAEITDKPAPQKRRKIEAVA